MLLPREVATILNCTLTKLSNWRNPTKLKDGIASHLYLPAFPIHEGSREVGYQESDVAEWLLRPQNAGYLDGIISTYCPDQLRDQIIRQVLGLLPPLPEGTPEPMPAAKMGHWLQQSAWSDFTNQPQNQEQDHA